MVLLSDIINEFKISESEFNRIYKCLNKKKRAKKEIEELHLNNIVIEYNHIKQIYFNYNNLFDSTNQLILLEILTKSHKRLLKVFERLKLDVKEIEELNVPTVEVENLSSEEEKSSEDEMAKSAIEFINFATKTIPEFDGSPAELQRFVDAVNLVNKNVGEFVESAIEVVKSKLKGTARNYITNEATLVAIVNKLKDKVKPESPKLVLSKLKTLKPSNKNPNDYIKEVENLATALQRSYICQGMSLDLAEEYTIDGVIQSVKANSPDEKVKAVLEARDFKSVSDISEKYLSVKSENSQTNSQVNYFQRNNFDYYRGDRYNNRRFFSNNRNFYRNNANTSFNSNQINSKPNFAGNRGNRNDFRGNPRIRYAEAEAENSNDPQSSTEILQLRDM